MPYKLYIDKPEIFECEVAVKNASLKNSIARLVVESENVNLVFKGQIQNGKCIVPIQKVKGLLDESVKGTMHLEIIVEDTYFTPWKSDFVVEEHTSVKVQIKEQSHISHKPILEVKVNESVGLSLPAKEIIHVCKLFEINKNNYQTTKKSDFKQLLKEYFAKNKEFSGKLAPILNEVVTYLR